MGHHPPSSGCSATAATLPRSLVQSGLQPQRRRPPETTRPSRGTSTSPASRPTTLAADTTRWLAARLVGGTGRLPSAGVSERASRTDARSAQTPPAQSLDVTPLQSRRQINLICVPLQMRAEKLTTDRRQRARSPQQADVTQRVLCSRAQASLPNTCLRSPGHWRATGCLSPGSVPALAGAEGS
jgi:hypothetical protein